MKRNTSLRIGFLITGCQGTEALAFARRKRSSGAFTSGLTPQDRRHDLQLTTAVRVVLQVDLEHPHEQMSLGYFAHPPHEQT